MSIATFLLLSVALLAAVGACHDTPDSAAAQTIPAAPCPLICQLGINFAYPHLGDCGRFYRCRHGRLLEFKCPAGRLFDMATLRCQTEGRCILPAL